MSDYYYSAIQNTFVAAGSSLLKLPDYTDATPVDLSVFTEFYPGYNSKNQRRIAGSDGMPRWEDIPPLTDDEISEQAVRQANKTKSALLFQARDTINIWQTELQLGEISDDDKKSLIAWLAYIKMVQAIDTSTAPGISWPEQPDNG